MASTDLVKQPKHELFGGPMDGRWYHIAPTLNRLYFMAITPKHVHEYRPNAAGRWEWQGLVSPALEPGDVVLRGNVP